MARGWVRVVGNDSFAVPCRPVKHHSAPAKVRRPAHYGFRHRELALATAPRSRRDHDVVHLHAGTSASCLAPCTSVGTNGCAAFVTTKQAHQSQAAAFTRKGGGGRRQRTRRLPVHPTLPHQRSGATGQVLPELRARHISGRLHELGRLLRLLTTTMPAGSRQPPLSMARLRPA